MARPPKKPELRMDTDLRIPVTAADKLLIQQAAELAELDMAAWIRPILRQAAVEQCAQHRKANKK